MSLSIFQSNFNNSLNNIRHIPLIQSSNSSSTPLHPDPEQSNALLLFQDLACHRYNKFDESIIRITEFAEIQMRDSTQ
jgi:hypothetical protein